MGRYKAVFVFCALVAILHISQGTAMLWNSQSFGLIRPNPKLNFSMRFYQISLNHKFWISYMKIFKQCLTISAARTDMRSIKIACLQFGSK